MPGLFHRLRNWRNPHNLTQLHLRAIADRRGYLIGDHSYGSPRLRFPIDGTQLSIGRYCSFADGVEIFLSGNHRTDWVSTFPFFDFPERWPGAANPGGHPASRGPVVIGNDVWIGAGAVILSGVTIGDGACIGARAVVSRDVPPYAVVAGNPASLVRMRFPDSVITALLEARWWDRPDHEVQRLIPLLLSDDTASLLSALMSPAR